MARRDPTRRLNSVDFPTLGRPTIATVGMPTAAAADIDLTHDALADPRGVSGRRGFDDANELMAGDATESGVAFEQLQVRAANAGHPDADAALPFAVGLRHIGESHASRMVDDERSHGVPTVATNAPEAKRL